jgi:hypothetical protein
MGADQIGFAVFCIESVAERIGRGGDYVYRLLTEGSNILDDYIIPNTDMLHTQGKEYIINDIMEYMIREGLID